MDGGVEDAGFANKRRIGNLLTISFPSAHSQFYTAIANVFKLLSEPLLFLGLAVNVSY